MKKLPTLKQIENLGSDAGKVLDAIENELTDLYRRFQGDPYRYFDRKAISQRLFRLRRRRKEFFGND
jgi:hypothetical protein